MALFMVVERFRNGGRSNGLRFVGRVIRYAWALPATTLGLVLAAFALGLGATARIVDGAVEVAGGRLERIIARPPFRFVAITFGHVIIGVDHGILRDVRDHEHVHVRQYERWGVCFFPLYLGSSLVHLCRGRDPYLHNRFEREAYASTRKHAA